MNFKTKFWDQKNEIYRLVYTDKRKLNFPQTVYNEIPKGAVAIDEEGHKYLGFSHIWGGRWSCMTFLIYEENFIIFFYQCTVTWRPLRNEDEVCLWDNGRHEGQVATVPAHHLRVSRIISEALLE